MKKWRVLFVVVALNCLQFAEAADNFNILDKGPTLGTVGIDQTTPGATNAVVPKDTYAITQSAVPMTGSSVSLVTVNAARRYLAWMVIGTADVTCVAGAGPAVTAIGFVYQASGAGKQGASQEFPHGSPTVAFQCIGAAGSIIYVWEGI